MVFSVVIHGIETTGKVFISQFFCTSPSNVLAHRRRFEQLIVAQVHDALRFSAQRNTPSSLFAPLDLSSPNTDLLTDADLGNHAGSGVVALPTAVSVDRGTDSGSVSSTSGAVSNSGAAGSGSGGSGVGSSTASSIAAGINSVASAIGGVGSSASATLGGSSGWAHSESGAFVLDLSLCDAAERSWLVEVSLERRKEDLDEFDADNAGDEPRLFVFWRAIHSTCFTLVCDSVDNRQLAVQWLDVMARMIAEHFRNPNVLHTPDVLLSQPAELHFLLHQLLPSGQLLFLTDSLAKLMLRNSEQSN